MKTRENTFKKLRVQIALHYILASALTLLFMALVLYASISSILLSESAKNTKTSVHQSGMYLDLYIDRLNAVSSILAENTDLIRYLSDKERDSSIKKICWKQSIQLYQQILLSNRLL